MQGDILTTSSSVREVNTPDGAALLDVEQGLCFSLNPVGARIWQLLKLHKSVDHIAVELAAEYKVPEAQIREDVASFMNDLNDKHLLSPSELDGKRGRSATLRAIVRRLTL